jgi:hypothetical protein
MKNNVRTTDSYIKNHLWSFQNCMRACSAEQRMRGGLLPLIRSLPCPPKECPSRKDSHRSVDGAHSLPDFNAI